MPLKPVSAASWEQEIADVAATEFKGVISILRPGEPGTYDPVTDGSTGGTEPTVLIDHRPARIQHVRLPLETVGSSEWSGKRRVRIQIALQADDPLITKGLVARVDDGGRDHSLEFFSYEVVSAFNSSNAALRTIECVSEGAVVNG